MDASPARSRLAWLPNALTMTRVALAPLTLATLIVAAAQSSNALLSPWTPLAAAFLLLAAALDWLDGKLARALGAESAFGRFWDPVADKLVIGAALIGGALVAGSMLFLLPAALLLWRDATVTWLRSQPRHAAAIAAPSRLAKWKTALEYLALILLFSAGLFARALGIIAPGAAQGALVALLLGATLILWIACVLSLWTGWSYLRRAGGPFIKR